MNLKISYCILIFILFFGAKGFSQNTPEQIPSKEALMQAILDPNVDEVEAIELMAKYYPELLNSVVEAGKDFDKAHSVQNAKETGEYYQELGQKFLDKKDYDQAIIYFQKAIVQKKQSQGGSTIHPQISKSYQGLGEAFEWKKDDEKALEAYQRSIISNTSRFDETDLLSFPEADNIISNQLAIPIFESKGDLLLKSAKDEGRLLGALTSYERAIDVIELVCRKYTSEDSKLNLNGEVVLLSEKAIIAALKLYQITRNPAFKSRSFKLAEKSKAMVLTATLLEKNYYSEIPRHLYDKEQRIKIKIAQLEQKHRQVQNRKEEREKVEKQLFSLNQSLYLLNDTLETYYPKAAYHKYQPSSLAVDSLQWFLEDNEAALVEYFIGPNAAFAFTLTESDLKIDRLEDIEEAQSRIIALRKDLQSHNFKKNAEQSFANFTSHAGAIYSMILEKAVQNLGSHTRDLIIVPDAALWLLPFELLLTGQVKGNNTDFSPDYLPYLFNQYAVTYAHSAKLAMNNHSSHLDESSIPFTGFAPDFSETELASRRSCLGDGSTLGSLKFNQSELENIQKYFEGEAYFGVRASRDNFLKMAGKSDIIHCSTHACLNEDDPLGNRIYFSNNEFLTTADIYTLNLKARMTVLSACQTGLGQIYNGEGVISLARAFTQAGCRSITMSLWPVADKATAELMEKYYKNLDQGFTKSESLRQAKLEYLQEQPKAKQHPYYWAAFVHLGDFSPVNASKAGGSTFWVMCLGGVIILGWVILAKKRN